VAEFASSYGLFVAELVTVIALIVIAAASLIGAARRGGGRGEGLEVRHLNREIEEAADAIRRSVEGKHRFKRLMKARAKERKKEDRAKDRRRDGGKEGGKDAGNERTKDNGREGPIDGRLEGREDGAPGAVNKDAADRDRLFVLDFKGDIRATGTASLRKEITAILAVATLRDQVLVRLDNAGGTVHEHGLAASQLMRVKRRGIPLLVAVDKVAASGGYLMATVADRIIAAPFAIIGSIGVLAQLPNFHRLLEQNGIDFEQITAGRYKRTLTLFGKNTDEGRDKLREELEEVHDLFKHEIAEHRPQVSIEEVATGEHWYGTKALELKLVDEIATSDDFLLDAVKERDVYHVAYKRRRRLQERLMGGAESLLARG
jgi:serine protease SohB